MADYILSSSMNLPVPIVGIASGPTWATLLDQCLSVIDGHTHTAGSGVPITPSAININSSLAINNQLLTLAQALTLTAQPSALPASGVTLGAVYVTGVDLYYNDFSGNQVRITQSGGVAGSPGSISGLAAPASASYVAGNQTFVWQSDTNTAANLDAGYIVLRNSAANSPGLFLQAPLGLASSYNLYLPNLPGSTSFLTLDTSGNIGNGPTLANGITRSNLAALGQQTSGNISFSTTSTSIVDVTNSSLTITTHGRPVQLVLNPQAGADASLSASGSTSTTAQNLRMQWRLVRDAGAGFVQVAGGFIGGVGAGAPGIVAIAYASTSSIQYFDTPSAGTYTYKLQIASVSGSITCSVTNANLVAYELF